MRLPQPLLTRRLIAILIAVVVTGGAYYLVLYPHIVHRRWYTNVETRILRLAERRPENVDPKQWAACLHWTWNLHANYSAIPYVEATARRPFLEEFDRRVAGPVELATIDWIWDWYGLHTSGGKRYSDNFRPTVPERMEETSLDRYHEFDLGMWIEQNRVHRAL